MLYFLGFEAFERRDWGRLGGDWGAIGRRLGGDWGAIAQSPSWN
ncbi:hypothetical protein [Leptolyngbya sp. O-77]|nr:hypothetical protein [Leptolyngbya sp. O-77]